MNHPIIDSGVNLMHRSFHQDREQVVERAASNNVSPLIITGTSLRNSVEATRYAGEIIRDILAKLRSRYFH